MAALVEPSAFGPFEGARLAIDPHGHVLVASGCSSQGQGHETVLAQVAADVLRRAARTHHGAPWRHRAHSVRRRKLCEPHRRHVGARGLFGRRSRSRRRRSGPRRRSWKSPSRTCGWSTAASSWSARPGSTFRSAPSLASDPRAIPNCSQPPTLANIPDNDGPRGDRLYPRRAQRHRGVRGARCRGRGRRGHRTDHRRALSGRGRRRPRDQSDARRGPARRRRRSGAGRHAARGDRLRRRTASCRPALSPTTCCRRSTKRRRSRRCRDRARRSPSNPLGVKGVGEVVPRASPPRSATRSRMRSARAPASTRCR